MLRFGDRRVWFITGASRGLGASIATEALAAGDVVVATARDPVAVRARFGDHDRLLRLPLDVQNEQQVQSAVRDALTSVGHVDVLVNNAGHGLIGSVEETSSAEVEALFGINVFGLISVTRSVLPNMRQRRRGHIINMSSVGGYRSGAGFGMYCATKFAVEGLSEALRVELAPLGIKVTLVEPGRFRTGFWGHGSMLQAKNRIVDYEATVGVLRDAIETDVSQSGDPAMLAKAVLELVNAPDPPMRLPLGSDAVAAIEHKNRIVEWELEQWRSLALSTDFPDVSATGALAQ